LKKTLASNNIELLKVSAIQYVQTYVAVVEKLLEGSIVGNPDVFGQTLREERLESST
jgi:hypothetical protein